MDTVFHNITSLGQPNLQERACCSTGSKMIVLPLTVCVSVPTFVWSYIDMIDIFVA